MAEAVDDAGSDDPRARLPVLEIEVLDDAVELPVGQDLVLLEKRDVRNIGVEFYLLGSLPDA